VILKDALGVTWHPHDDVLLYALSKDDGYNITQSEVYFTIISKLQYRFPNKIFEPVKY